MTYIITGENKPPLDEIYHYGVKGMRQHKNNPNRTRASRMTLGEQAAATVLTLTTGRNAVVRTRQNSGYYDRKYA